MEQVAYLKLVTALDAIRSRGHLIEQTVLAVIAELPTDARRRIAQRTSDQAKMQTASAPDDQPPAVAAAVLALLQEVRRVCGTGE